MGGASLRDFVRKGLHIKRIRFADPRRLQRDVLPARITNREQAEVLIALDDSLDQADREWRRYLISTVRDFIVWGTPPAGRIDRGKAEWLVAALRTSSRKTAGAISRGIQREAPEVEDHALQALSINSRRGRARREGATGAGVPRPPAGP